MKTRPSNLSINTAARPSAMKIRRSAMKNATIKPSRRKKLAPRSRKPFALSAAALVAMLSIPAADAAIIYYDGGGTAATGLGWGTAANWSTVLGAATPDPGAAPTGADDVVFSITGAVAGFVGMNADRAANSLTFSTSVANTLMSHTTTTTSFSLTLGSGGITIDSGAGAVTIGEATRGTLTTILGASQSWTHNGGNLFSVIQPVNLGANTLTLAGSGAGGTTISGAISGAGGLTVDRSGAGVVTLSSASNSFSGQLNIARGIVSIASINNASANGVLGNSALSVILGSSGANTGTLRYTAASGSSNKRFTFAAGGTGEINLTGAALTLSGLLDGSGTFLKTGTGTLTISNAVNQLSGNTVISAGKVALGGQFSLWQSAYDTTGSTGAIGLNVTGQVAPWLGGLAGSVNLATAITGYTGLVTALTLNPQAGSSVSYGGIIANGSGAMTLSKTGHGTQTLTGTNSYTGATTVWAGTLGLAGASGTATTSAFTVRGGTLLLDNSTAWANRLNDATALSLGSLTLTSSNGAGVQSEAVGTTTFAVGGKVTINNGTTGGDQTTLALTTGNVVRSVGAAIDFVGTNGTLGGGANSPNVTTFGFDASAAEVNGILPWATVGGTQWAEDNANSIRAYSGSFTTLAAATTSDNAQLTGSLALGAAEVGNSLNLITSGAGESLSLGANNLTLGSAAGSAAAILKSGADAYTISGTSGQLRAGSAGAGTELIAHVDGGALTISAPLNTAIVSIAKGGTGDLILSGTRAGTMSGNISIAGGQLEFQGASTTLSGVITGAGGLTVNLSAGQTLTINSNSNSYAGPTIVTGGYFSGAGFPTQGLPGGINQTPGTNTSQIMSNLILNGGAIYNTYTFNKDLGAGPGQVQVLAGTSGFVNTANSGGATGFVLDGGRELVWGSTYFNPTVFVHSLNNGANLTLNLANGFDLAGSTRTILVGDSAYNGSTTGGVSQLGGVIRTSSGTAGLTKTGIGELLLTGASTYNGATTVSNGTLSFSGNANVASANPLGQSSAAAANLLLANGTTLEYSGAAASTDRSFTINGTAAGHGASLDASGSAAINFTSTASPAYGTNNQTRTLTLTGTNTNNNILAANIADNGTGAVSVTKTGAGLWVLSGTSSSYTGPTTISAGTLSVSATANLGGATSNLVFNGGTLQITNTTNLPNFSTIGHTVVFNSGQTVGLDISSGTFTADQVLNQGNGGLTKTGAGTLALNQANTYAGNTTISVGTLQLGSGTAGGSLNTGSAINVASGATFAINQSDTVTQGIDFGRIGGAGALSKLGSNTLVLNAPTFHTGTTTVSGGTLELTHALALQNSALVTTGAGTVTLDCITTPTFGGLSGASGDLDDVITTGYAGITNLTLKPESGSVTYGGVIVNNAEDLSLTKTGAGTQVFQGANLYEGATFLNGGTLELSGSGSILGTSGITFNNGSLTLTNTAAETGSGRINANAITSNGGTLTYNNTSGANVYAETIGSVALTSGQLNIVQAVNQAGAGSQTLTLGGLTRPGATSAVTFSSAGTRTTKNIIVVTGATATAANEIIGPWATIGTAANNQTDYAIYNGSAQVVERNIAASLESTWSTVTSATSNYTMGAKVTLTAASKNINTLRSSAAGSTFTLIDSTDTFTITGHGYVLNDPIVLNGTGTAPGTTFGTVYYVRDETANTFKLAATPGGAVVNLTAVQTGTGSNYATGAVNLGNFNLGTTGILNGGTNGTLAIASSGTGVVTLPTTTAENLYVTAGSGAIFINAPINDNTASGVLSLVKGGAGSLTLNATNGFTGHITINAGSLTFSTAASWGSGTKNLTFAGTGTLTSTAAYTSGGVLAVNTGATATLGASGLTFTSATGAGTLIYAPTVAGQTLNIGDANAFTGNLRVDTGGTTNAHPVLRFSALSDAVGSKIQSGGTNGDSNQQVNVQFIGTAPLVFNNRVIEILLPPSSNGPRYTKLISSSASATNTWTINTDLSMLSTASRELELMGTNTGDNTFAGVIGNGNGTIGLTKSDAGTWIVSGSNSYTGATTINAGTLQISTLANGGEVSSIGASSNATANLILNGGTLRYTGAAVNTNRRFALQISSTINSSGTGAINFNNTAAMGFNGGTAAKTLTLTGTNTGNNTIAAAIGDNTGATAITKSGIGTWVLSGANTHTGATSLNGGGKLVLDYTANNAKIAAGAALDLGSATLTSLGGGTLDLSGGSFAQSVSATTLKPGGTFITRSSGASTLNLNALTTGGGGDRGGSISFSANGIATTDKTNTNGILAGYATVGADWAVNSTNAADGSIIALTTYTALPTSGSVSTTNYSLTGSLTLAGATAVNSLKIIASADGQTLGINSRDVTPTTHTNSSGVLFTAGGNGYTYNITGTSGAIKAASPNNDIFFHVIDGTLNVTALVSAGTGLVVKAGDGTLILGANNTYNAITYVNEGVLRLTHAAGAGAITSGIGVQNLAALELANGISVGAKALTITGTGVSNGGALRNIASNTSGYAGAITIGTGGARINSDASGLLTLTGGVVTSRFNDVTFGGAGNTTVSTVAISGAGGLVQDGLGTTTLNFTNTYTGGTRVDAGTLTLGHATNTLNNGGTVDVNGGTLDIGGNSDTVGAVTMGSGSITGTSGVLTGTSYAVQSGTASANLAGTGATMTKTTSGTVTLSGTNTYTGSTLISAGTLQYARMESLYNNTPASWTAANINVKSGATLALNVDSAGTAGFDSGNLNTLLTNISVAASDSTGLHSGAVLGFDTSTATAGTFTQGNIIANSTGICGGAISLTKSGAGILVFDKANTYTGATTIQAGSLVAGTSSLASTDGAFGNAASALVLGNASTLVGDAPAVLINGAFTVGRDISVGSVANAAAYNATIGGSNTTGTSSYTGNITLGTTAANYTATLRAATGGTVDFNTGTWTTNNKAIAIGTSGNTGTVQLSNTLSTTGAVNVNFGTFYVNGALNGGGSDLTVASGATLGGTGSIAKATNIQSGGIYSPGNSPGTVTHTAGLTLGSGSIFNWENDTVNAIGTAGTNWDVANITGGTLTLDNTATTGSQLRLQFTNVSTDFTDVFWNTNRTWDFITGGVSGANAFDATNITIFDGGIQVGSNNTVTGQGSFTTIVSGSNEQLVWTAASGSIPTAYWAGATDGDWGTLNNWRDAATGGAVISTAPSVDTDVHFSTVTTPTPLNSGIVDLAANFSVKTLSFDASAPAVTIGSTGNFTLTITPLSSANGINVDTAANNNTLNVKVALGADQTWTVGSGRVLTANGEISGGFDLTKAGSGTLTVSGANSYTGDTEVAEGTVKLAATDSLPTGTDLSVLAPGIFDLAGFNQAIASLTGVAGAKVTNTAAAAGTATLTSNQTTTTTYAGLIEENGGGSTFTAFTLNGTGTLNLSGNNTYRGGTIVNAGTLTGTGTNSSLGATTGTLQVNNPNTGAGTAVVLNLSTTAPTTTGSLSGTIATPGSGTNTATINNGGQTYTVNQTANSTFAGNIAGAGGFTLGSSSTNTLTFSGNNGYTGTTTVSAGTLAVTGSLSGTTVVNNSGTMLLNSTSNANNIVGDGTATPTASTQAITGAVGTTTYTGTTGSTLAVGNTNAGGVTNSFTSLTLSGTSTLDFASGNTNNNFIFGSFTTGVASALFNNTAQLNITNWTGADHSSQFGGAGAFGTNTNAGAADSGTFNDGYSRLLFTTDPGFGMGNYITGITFNGSVAGMQVAFGSMYEIVPVPEPATTALIGAVALCALIGYRERRRFVGFRSRMVRR